MLEFIMYDIHPEYPVFPNFHLHSINTVIQIYEVRLKVILKLQSEKGCQYSNVVMSVI